MTGFVIICTADNGLAKKGEFFHFFDRANYDCPQFGDRYHARVYPTRRGASSRVRALRAFGYEVEYQFA